MTTTELAPVTFSTGEGPDDWREISLTGYENRMSAWAADHADDFLREGVPVPGRSKIRRIAYRLAKEQAVFHDEDLWQVFSLPDPTATTAIRNIERTHHHLYRRNHIPVDAADEEEFAPCM